MLTAILRIITQAVCFSILSQLLVLVNGSHLCSVIYLYAGVNQGLIFAVPPNVLAFLVFNL